jgi:hypothetical protein
MPTAVERFLDSFLKLAGFDGRHEQAALNDAFLKIDGDFLKLSSANSDTFVKIEHRPGLQHDFDVIGDAFIKLSHDFGKIAFAGALIDDFFLKVTAATTAELNTAAAEGAPNPQADFIKMDAALKTSAADFKILGLDFNKLAKSPSLDVFQVKIAGISDDFSKLGNDMAADGNAFLKLAADFVKLGSVDNPSPLDLAYKDLGGELQTVGSQFGALSMDFFNLVPAVQAAGGGGSGGTATSDAFVKLNVGLDFMALNQDFHKLDSALGAVGDGAAAVIGGLLHQSFGGSGHGTS